MIFCRDMGLVRLESERWKARSNCEQAGYQWYEPIVLIIGNCSSTAMFPLRKRRIDSPKYHTFFRPSWSAISFCIAPPNHARLLRISRFYLVEIVIKHL